MVALAKGMKAKSSVTMTIAVLMTRVMLWQPWQLYGGPGTVSLHPTTGVALSLVARNICLLLAACDAARLLLAPKRQGGEAAKGVPSSAEHAKGTA